jgi:hypothetical protein
MVCPHCWREIPESDEPGLFWGLITVAAVVGAGIAGYQNSKVPGAAIGTILGLLLAGAAYKLRQIIYVILVLIAIIFIASMIFGSPNQPAQQPTASAPPEPGTAPSEPPNAQPGAARRVPHPLLVQGDMERIFEAARAQREHREKREEGEEKDISEIKAVYAREKLGSPVRIVPTYDSHGGFRYIVVTGTYAAHVVYLTP